MGASDFEHENMETLLKFKAKNLKEFKEFFIWEPVNFTRGSDVLKFDPHFPHSDFEFFAIFRKNFTSNLSLDVLMKLFLYIYKCIIEGF